MDEKTEALEKRVAELEAFVAQWAFTAGYYRHAPDFGSVAVEIKTVNDPTLAQVKPGDIVGVEGTGT